MNVSVLDCFERSRSLRTSEPSMPFQDANRMRFQDAHSHINRFSIQDAHIWVIETSLQARPERSLKRPLIIGT